MARALPDPDLLQHPFFTTGGLFVEAHAGLQAGMEKQLTTEAGISPQWFDVLMRLARTPGHRLRMTDLAAQTILSASGLTRAVDRLEGVGLVRREACPSDRRGSYAVLTDAGLEAVAAAAPAHLALMTQVLEIFTPAEVETLTALLHRLRDHVNPEAACASDPRLTHPEAEAPA
jgi:DNA-binding MarR family transcriptional regulator